MRVSKLKLPLEALFENANFILTAVSPYYEYREGEKTEHLLGYKYEVVEDGNFERFSVKVPSIKPIITAEMLEKSSSRIFVTFEDAFGRIYQTPVGSLEISFSAVSAKLLEA